jgi:hypothetical protein
MKTNRILLTLTTFLVGVGVGVGTFALISFSSSTAVPSTSKPTPIDKLVGSAYTENYYTVAPTITGKIKAWLVDTAQVNLMKTLSDNDKSIAAFRIYLGLKDPRGTERNAVVAVVDKNENDILSSIYQTTAGHIGPCPTICDRNSSPLNH